MLSSCPSRCRVLGEKDSSTSEGTQLSCLTLGSPQGKTYEDRSRSRLLLCIVSQRRNLLEQAWQVALAYRSNHQPLSNWHSSTIETHTVDPYLLQLHMRMFIAQADKVEIASKIAADHDSSLYIFLYIVIVYLYEYIYIHTYRYLYVYLSDVCMVYIYTIIPYTPIDIYIYIHCAHYICAFPYDLQDVGAFATFETNTQYNMILMYIYFKQAHTVWTGGENAQAHGHAGRSHRCRGWGCIACTCFLPETIVLRHRTCRMNVEVYTIYIYSSFCRNHLSNILCMVCRMHRTDLIDFATNSLGFLVIGAWGFATNSFILLVDWFSCGYRIPFN